MNFNIYGVNFYFKSAPPHVAQLFHNEWNLFLNETKNSGVSIYIKFLDSIDIDSSAKLLQSSYPGEFLAYHNGNIYLFKDQKVHLKLDEICKKSININCKKDVSEDELFSLLERLLLIKLIENGHTINHASCFKIREKAYAFSSLSGVGKSKLLMHYLKTREERVEFISDDILIVDKNLVALPYPRGINIKEYDKDLFYKTLIRSSLKDISRYFFHFFKRKILSKKGSIYSIRAFMHKLWNDINISRSKINILFILEKRENTPVKKVSISKKELGYFLKSNIELELYGSLRRYFDLLQLIDDLHVDNFNKYLHAIRKQQFENNERFCASVKISKILVGNDFDLSSIEKQIFS